MNKYPYSTKILIALVCFMTLGLTFYLGFEWGYEAGYLYGIEYMTNTILEGGE